MKFSPTVFLPILLSFFCLIIVYVNNGHHILQNIFNINGKHQSVIEYDANVELNPVTLHNTVLPRRNLAAGRTDNFTA
jgi:hypothetical protein